MRSHHIAVPLLAFIASFTSLRAVPRAQEHAPQSIVDGVVNAVCQKQIVLLGELPTHGEALAFEAKSKIADRLIAQCGFNATLFEAGVYDFIGLERAVKANSAAQEQLDNAIGRFWWTRELAPWRRSLFQAAAQKRLVIGGIDDQPSITSYYATANLPKLIAATLTPPAAVECQQTVSRHLAYSYDAKTPFDEREQLKLQQCARSSAIAAFTSPLFDDADQVMLESFARYADRQRANATSNRDESLYRNLAWYVDRLPAGSRVVVWTATVHAAKQRGSLTDTPMGAQVAARWGDRVASVGFTASGGSTSRAARPAAPIADAPADSLEAIATKESPWALLTSEKLRIMGRISSRLLGKFATETWSDYFDAVVVIKQETAPTFDPWK